jgi:uncharacterized cupin superfamily protein
MYALTVQSDDPKVIAEALRKELALLEHNPFHSATAIPAREAGSNKYGSWEAQPGLTRVFMPSDHVCEGVCDCTCFR